MPQLTEEQVRKLKEMIKKDWAKTPTKELISALAFEQRIKQQIEIRIETLQEMLDERQPDFKSKQFSD